MRSACLSPQQQNHGTCGVVSLHFQWAVLLGGQKYGLQWKRGLGSNRPPPGFLPLGGVTPVFSSGTQGPPTALISKGC